MILCSLVSDPHMEHATKWHHGDMSTQEDKLCAHPNRQCSATKLRHPPTTTSPSLPYITLLLDDYC